ncbi:unnamed protein product [Prorocentrum cordatum]|uniref:Uncharacterized protein n=1 Tax=Prorocentrum cordatum TaxID=2364126 RepID=A0ABN9PRG9_9DINO|nr:unnamed protein product [Polarella glacialis]
MSGISSTILAQYAYATAPRGDTAQSHRGPEQVAQRHEELGVGRRGERGAQGLVRVTLALQAEPGAEELRNRERLRHLDHGALFRLGSCLDGQCSTGTLPSGALLLLNASHAGPLLKLSLIQPLAPKPSESSKRSGSARPAMLK